jgi:hypothetical protein
MTILQLIDNQLREWGVPSQVYARPHGNGSISIRIPHFGTFNGWAPHPTIFHISVDDYIILFSDGNLNHDERCDALDPDALHKILMKIKQVWDYAVGVATYSGDNTYAANSDAYNVTVATDCDAAVLKSQTTNVTETVSEEFVM